MKNLLPRRDCYFQKVPFQPHFRQNTRLFQDPEDPHSTTMKICKPLHVHMLCKLQVTNALTHLNVKQLTNRLNNVNQSLFLPSVPLHEEKYGIGCKNMESVAIYTEIAYICIWLRRFDDIRHYFEILGSWGVCVVWSRVFGIWKVA